MAPQKKVFKKSWIEAEEVVRLGTSETDARRFDARLLSDDIRRKLMLHGLTQKLSDATAMAAGTPLAEKWAAIDDVWQALIGGEWSLKREGAGTLLVRALCELYPSKSKEAVKEWLDAQIAKDKNAKTALENAPAIRAIIDRLRAEKASTVDVDALLDELAD